VQDLGHGEEIHVIFLPGNENWLSISNTIMKSINLWDYHGIKEKGRS
jgi:hypothetical protein